MWILVAISSYFLLSVTAITDKFLLKGSMPSPKIYAFYSGFSGILILFLIPFGFYIPNFSGIILAVLAGLSQVLGIVVLYVGLKKFEASRIVSSIGGLSPIFAFLLTYIFSGFRVILPFSVYLALSLLVVGSFLISWAKNQRITWQSLKISAIAAFLFSLYLTLSKLVFLEQTFLNGLIWMRIGAFLSVLFFLFSKDVRQEIFHKREAFRLKTLSIFGLNSLAGAGAGIIQSLAITMANIAYIPIIAALSGTQYVFLLFLSLVLSLKSPKILKEEISRDTIIKKIIAILFIGGGLALLTF
ncbi:MAG: hypothetical protein AAB451_02745 [Patescibacteria group bacterium]